MTPEQRTAALKAGEAAAEFYEQHPFEAARQAVIQRWTKAETVTEREDCWYELKALARIVSTLTTAGQNAKVAAMEIKMEQTQVDEYEHP